MSIHPGTFARSRVLQPLMKLKFSLKTITKRPDLDSWAGGLTVSPRIASRRKPSVAVPVESDQCSHVRSACRASGHLTYHS